MLPRTARRLESTLLLYSRQSLPRPARLHNSASARSSAQASAAASSLQPGYHIPAHHASSQQEEDARPVSREMQNFLKRRTSYTLLPVPLPDDRASALNDLYFADSVTQDLVAVMDACLHNLSYVSRAKGIFDRLRREKKGDPILEPRLYNTFLQAYVEMATTKGKQDYVLWVEEAWELYAQMESGVEGISPTPATYAIMLIALHRSVYPTYSLFCPLADRNVHSFSPDSSTPLPNTPKHTATTILTGILNRDFPLTDVVSDRVFTSSSEASAIIQVLSQSAVDLGKTEAVHELGRATALGTTAYDPLQGVPEANPVLVPVSYTIASINGGSDAQIVYASRRKRMAKRRHRTAPSSSPPSTSEISANISVSCVLHVAHCQRTSPRDKSCSKSPFGMSLRRE
jgi:DNA-directed RNA polymerase, mitochondrial